MTVVLIQASLSLIVGICLFVIKNLTNKVRDLDKGICDIRTELMKRADVIDFVDKEIGRLNVQRIEDKNEIKELIYKMSDKLDRLIERSNK